MSLSKPRPILKDMPYHIKKMIVKGIPSYLDRLPLRKVSKEFMGVVDTKKVEMTFEIRHKSVRIDWETSNRLLKEHSFNKEVADHFKCFVLKRNVSFSKISISGDRAHPVELVEMLTATVKRPLRVKDFTMWAAGQAKFLEFMEPGTLERVTLIGVDRIEADTIFRMEQWRQAKNVHLIAISAACEVWWDFPRFEMQHIESIDSTDLPRILEHISNSDTFVHGVIHEYWTIDAIVEALGRGNWEWKQNGARQFAEKEFAVGNHGSKIVVKAFDTYCDRRRVEFVMERGE